MYGIINFEKEKIFETDSKSKSYKFQDNKYTICYSGHIYNYLELKELLTRKDIELETREDTELLIKLYIVLGKDFIKRLNGAYGFVIWNEKEKEGFAVRDRFGLEPFYYTKRNQEVIFASTIKEVLKYSNIKPQITETEIGELIGIGPAHSPGKTPFKDIFELEPANYIVINADGLYKEEYWKLKAKYHTDDLETTCNRIRELMIDAVRLEVESSEEVPVSSLSGGLDSSIVTAIANYVLKRERKRFKNFFCRLCRSR